MGRVKRAEESRDEGQGNIGVQRFLQEPGADTEVGETLQLQRSADPQPGDGQQQADPAKYQSHSGAQNKVEFLLEKIHESLIRIEMQLGNITNKNNYFVPYR
jgi:hypothetical protein